MTNTRHASAKLKPYQRPTLQTHQERPAPVIKILRRLGFMTWGCCQGEAGSENPRPAHIEFACRHEAHQFVALAGGGCWIGPHLPADMLALRLPPALQPHLNFVRFPPPDIPRIARELLRQVWRVKLEKLGPIIRTQGEPEEPTGGPVQ